MKERDAIDLGSGHAECQEIAYNTYTLMDGYT